MPPTCLACPLLSPSNRFSDGYCPHHLHPFQYLVYTGPYWPCREDRDDEDYRSGRRQGRCVFRIKNDKNEPDKEQYHPVIAAFRI